MEETNQSLTKEEYDALVVGKDSTVEEDSSVAEAQKEETTSSESRSKDKIAEVGGITRKRKAAKVISDDKPDGEVDTTTATKNEKAVKKPKKKAKTVKLTFGNDEEG